MSIEGSIQGVRLEVAAALRGVLALGLVEAEGLSPGPLPPEFADDRDAAVARLAARGAGRRITDLPGVAETRALFHQLGIDPTKTRPSSEALLRRVLQGKGLPQVSPAVDVCNLCSLEHQLPLGLYDRDRVRGAVHVRVGRDGEGYEGIRRQRVNLAGRLLLADDEDPFGAPTADSRHTSVTAETRSLLVVVFCPAARAEVALATMLETVVSRLTRFCGTSAVTLRLLQ